MEIKDPKFKRGDKVIDEYGNIYIVLEISSYSFINNDYWYGVENDVEKRVMLESKLELYQEPSKTVWELQDGDECYFINVNGSVLPGPWDGNPLQIGSREIGNVFLTKDEAGTEVERRKIEAEMLRLGGRRKFKFNGNNFSIYYSDGLNVKGINVEFYHSTMHQGSIYFDSKEQLNEVVKTIGLEKIKKYIFVVES